MNFDSKKEIFMKKIIVLLFMVSAILAQGEQYELNLNLGDSDTANYTIVKGDNLWNLAGYYYENPFEWRYIWEHNQYIQDPHWIYPGNKLFIPAIKSDKSETVKLYDTAKTFVQISEKVKKTPTQKQLSLIEKFKYYFSAEAQRQAPFIYEFGTKDSADGIDVFAYGEVIDGTKPLLVQYKDAQVIMNKDKAEQTKIGDRFDFYEARGNLQVKSINGIVVEPVASGEIKHINGNHAIIFLDKLWGLSSIKAKVAPIGTYKPLGEKLTYKVLNDSLSAGVIARMTPETSIKPGQIVFIDKGTNENVKIGDHFIFYKSDKRNKKIISEPIAEGLVIKTKSKTATVKINAAKEYSSTDSFIGIRQGGIVAQ